MYLIYIVFYFNTSFNGKSCPPEYEINLRFILVFVHFIQRGFLFFHFKSSFFRAMNQSGADVVARA